MGRHWLVQISMRDKRLPGIALGPYNDAMKVFISSLITDMDSLRAAAREAVLQLGHEPVMAEDIGARPHSPQVTCLSGVRDAGLMILILGQGYGGKQVSGLSATHEEYREAKDRCPVLAFVEQGVTRDVD
jgi:hypothetical protein